MGGRTDAMSNGNGIKEMVEKAQANLRKEESLTLPSGGIFSLLNQDEIADKIRREKEQQAISQHEIAEACNVTTELVTSIIDIEHFLVAGNPEFVASVKNDSNNVAMKAWASVTKFLQNHLRDGSVEERDGKFYFGIKKPHCVIPSRLSALQLLTKLTSPRQENGDELRALNMEEINQIAFNINAVVELKEVNGPHLRIGRKFFGVGQDNEMTEEFSEQFQRIVGKLITVNKVLVSEIRKQQSLTLHEQVTASTIEEALEKGGIYLAVIPDSRRDDGMTFFGGHVLLHFKDKTITIGGSSNQLSTDGNQYFCNTVAEIQRKGAKIPYEDVQKLLEKDIERLDVKKEPHDYRLWAYIRTHINWLRSYRQEKAIIAGMKEEGDLTIQEFLEGKVGNIVMVLERFNIKDNKVFKAIYPAAIRVSRVLIGSDKALLINEASPSMMTFVSNLIGEGKFFPENNLPSVLASFVTNWKKTNQPC